MPTTSAPADDRRRPLTLAAAAVVALSLAGFLVGTGRSTMERRRAGRALAVPDRAAEPGGGVGPTTRYAAMDGKARGPNASWRSDLAALAADATRTSRDAAALPAEVEQALQARAARRAYDGAPPMVPHPIDQRDPAACLACHETGLRAEALRAPAMSHGAMTNCTQCHAPTLGSAPPPRVDLPPSPPSLVPSGFLGEPAPRGGERAYEGAPPTTPHRTWLRERCESCHGSASHPGLQTSHLDRQSCTQCHAPSAALDQRQEGPGGPTAPTAAWP